MRGAGSGVGSAISGLEGNRALYIGNLAPSVDEHVLTTQFSMYGQVINAQVRLGPWLETLWRCCDRCLCSAV
jgi:hypothetical protein